MIAMMSCLTLALITSSAPPLAQSQVKKSKDKPMRRKMNRDKRLRLAL
jgi:hypothetical protein